MTDGISNEQFEKAIADAKAEKNLSRANVVRKVREEASADRWRDLEKLASGGYTSHQIGDKLGVSDETVRRKARKLGIEIRADVVLGRTRKTIDYSRVLADIIDTLDALHPSCDSVELSAIEPEMLKRGLKVLDDAMPPLSRLRRRMRKEATRV